MTTWTLVTGASSGIGAAIARRAAKDGRNLILTARRRDALDTVAAECRDAGAPDVRIIEADLSDEARIETMWREATTIGQVDVLINNAGLGTHGRLVEGDWWRERSTIGVNVIAATLLLKHAAAHMADAGGGHILNVASLAAQYPCPNMAIYGATKAYILSISEAVSEEMRGTGVHVSAVCPGFVATEFQSSADMGEVRAIKSGKLQAPEDVADAAWTGLMKGNRVIIPGGVEKAAAALSGVLPSAMKLKVNDLLLGEGEVDPDSTLGRMMAHLDRAGDRISKSVDRAGDKLSETFSKERVGSWRERAEETRKRATAEGGPLDQMKRRFEEARHGLKAMGSGANEAASKKGDAMNEKMAEQMRSGKGFVAALDQSGGSTPKALGQYGVSDDAWSNEDEMFDLIHAMRTRIVTAPDFTGEKIIGAILFEQTMDRDFEGKPAPAYLWEDKGVVPFLKVDKGLEDAANGVQLMKDMGDLESLLARAKARGVFGTKMRSVVGAANADGIEAITAQQFKEGNRILDAGLVPILEPEITISIPDKAEAEAMLRDAILRHLDGQDREVMLKLTLPEEPDFYKPLIDHPKVMRVVALSGGYSQEEANERLEKNHGMIASFSRGLAEGLSAQQSDDDFNAKIGGSIDAIYRASIT
jgi:fructose-bisphosphate aldolase class I